MKASRGISLLEILIVLATMVILAAFTFQSFRSLTLRKTLDGSASLVVAELNRARSLTLGSKDASEWGVHLESARVTLFKGSSYSAGGADNVVTTLDSRVRISTISLTGGAQDVIFQRLTGKTSQTGTIVLTAPLDASLQKTITLYGTGITQLQ